MNFYLVFFFYLTLKMAFGKNTRILGGEDADISEFPYVVSLRRVDEWRYFCTGVIVSDKHILTAAHCVYYTHKSKYKVFVGSDNITDYDTVNYDVQHVRIHPNFMDKFYSHWVLFNDIAILTVEQTIVFNRFVHKVTLPTGDIREGSMGIMCGWGWKSFPGGPNSKLQKLSVPIIPNDLCEDSFPSLITYRKVCTYQGYGKGSCFGDSGGPLISNGILVGISSFSFPCAVGKPDVFTRVYTFLNFIRISMSCLGSFCECLPIWD